MRRKSLTPEEVNEFNPSYDNPLTVKCNDKVFTGKLKAIKIISPVIKGRLTILDRDGEIGTMAVRSLRHYPSQKTPLKKVGQGLSNPKTFTLM